MRHRCESDLWRQFQSGVVVWGHTLSLKRRENPFDSDTPGRYLFIVKLKDLLNEIEDDYRGNHEAPTKGSGAPLYDVTRIYPDDIYTHPDAARYYGMNSGDADDRFCVAVIRMYHKKPKAIIKIYRAIPKVISTLDKIAEIEAEKRYILKYGKPSGNMTSHGISNKSKFYDFLCSELEKLQKLPPEPESKIQINPGDWITISKKYAREHGEANLLGKYRILTKTVRACEIFTTGDTLQEWGYDPQP